MRVTRASSLGLSGSQHAGEMVVCGEPRSWPEFRSADRVRSIAATRKPRADPVTRSGSDRSRDSERSPHIGLPRRLRWLAQNDLATLTAAYEDIRQTCVDALLIPNPMKLVAPQAAITAFDCDFTHGSANVRADRIAKFFASPRSAASAGAFEEYRTRIAAANK